MRLVKENPWYKSSSGCGKTSPSNRADRTRLHGRRLRRQPDREDLPGRSGQGGGGAAAPGRLRRGLARRDHEAELARLARTAPASTRRSPISSSPGTPTRASPSRKGTSSSTRTSRCSRARRRCGRTSPGRSRPGSAGASPTSSSKSANVVSASVARIAFPPTGSDQRRLPGDGRRPRHRGER